MKFTKTPTVEELQVVSRFDVLRKLLLTEKYAGCMDKPLAYWALPTDRRLPLALLGRTLGDLLNTPFSELTATPGIGQKKIGSFVKLLARVANSDGAVLHVEPALAEGGLHAAGPAGQENGFAPSVVSEVVWSQWRTSVLRHGFGKEALGRYAPTLRNMTRVVWNTSLECYAAMSLEEIRRLKTHGEKRVRAILEVFYSIHSLVSNLTPQEHLVVRLAPRMIDSVENWVGRALQTPCIPEAHDLRNHFVCPLLAQIRTDATRQIALLAENRLGITGPVTSVRQAARNMGLTRARIYQLLNEINDIMNVRWPMGRHQVYELVRKFEAESARMDAPPNLDQFAAAVELFYPSSRRGAAGSLLRAADVDEREEVAAEEDRFASFNPEAGGFAASGDEINGPHDGNRGWPERSRPPELEEVTS